jgi:glutamate--cysteine ligase
MSRLARADLAAHLLETAFTPPAAAALTPRRVGAEVEFLVLDGATGLPCPLEPDPAGGPPATLPFLRRFGARQGWIEGRTPKGAPSFRIPGGGSICFEPGGQLEYASSPSRSASSLITRLRAVAVPLRAAAAAEGITLAAVGIDPHTPVEAVPLQLGGDRYVRMAEHFARLGPAGARMMRQTASFQISLDFDDLPCGRWRLLNALAPWVTAIFANSPTYAGDDTGHQSFRAHCWRTLDPRRTGLPYDEARPVEAYLDFALQAPAILLPTVQGACLPFGDWVRRASPTRYEWEAHLSTLFPEVRPRGHAEVRACDAVDPEWYAAPIAFLSGLTYDERAFRAALAILPAPDPDLLERGGRLGLQDPVIGGLAGELVQLALQGCAALGPGFLRPSHLDEARAFFEHFTLRGRAPADEAARTAAAA